MQAIQTPKERFQRIQDFPYQEHYIKYNDITMHYIDEGNPTAEVILALHGQPTWSYLYRKFVPVLAKKYRFIAPDFIGFGKSDKLVSLDDYSYSLHYKSLIHFIEQVQLKDITLVVQDWGGLIGLGVLGHLPHLFKRVVILNTALANGERKVKLPFRLWQWYAKYHPNLPISGIVRKACARTVSKETLYAYDAPFPSQKYKAGARMFPSLVPETPMADGAPQMKQAAIVLAQWQQPAIVLFSDKDFILGKMAKFFYKLMPSARQQQQITIKNAGHFLQEDAGEELAQYIDDFIEGKLKLQP